MTQNKLTAEQMQELSAYERNFEQATKAAWCSYPGQAGIDKMLDTWESLTGYKYPYQPGCPNCLLNLVRDLGTIYFAQKEADQQELSKAAQDFMREEMLEADKQIQETEKAKEPKKVTRKKKK